PRWSRGRWSARESSGAARSPAHAPRTLRKLPGRAAWSCTEERPGPKSMSSEVLVLGTSVGLFAIGAAGALLHRHPVAMLMAVELMLNAANVLIVLGARVRGGADAEAAALIVLVLAAAEAVIGLALALALFRRKTIPDVDEAAEIHG